MKTKKANPWWTRWQRRWRQLRGHQQTKTHQVDWIWVDGERQKRVRFATPAEASAVVAGLTGLEPTGCFPALLGHAGRDVFMEFIPKARAGVPLADGVAGFYRAIYHHQLNPSPTLKPATLALAELSEGLMSLHSAGWIDDDLKKRVEHHAHQHAPAMMATGHDYVDAVAKNFMFHQGRWVGIDVEAIERERWLGLGLAKAEYRGLVAARDPDHWGIQDPVWINQYPIVRLNFLVTYFNTKLAQGKPGHIRIQALADAL